MKTSKYFHWSFNVFIVTFTFRFINSNCNLRLNKWFFWNKCKFFSTTLLSFYFFHIVGFCLFFKNVFLKDKALKTVRLGCRMIEFASRSRQTLIVSYVVTCRQLHWQTIGNRYKCHESPEIFINSIPCHRLCGTLKNPHYRV